MSFSDTLTPSVALNTLISQMNNLVAVAARRDREAYLAAERCFNEAVAGANAVYNQSLQVLRKERAQRGEQVRAIRAQVDAIEQERHQCLKQLDSELEAKHEAARQRIQQATATAAAALAQAKRLQAMVTDQVDAARALINQYDDLAGELAQVDEQILHAAEQDVTKAELIYQATLTDQANHEVVEIQALETAYQAAKAELMAQCQSNYAAAVASEVQLVQQIKGLAHQDCAIIIRLREERGLALAAARATFDEECIWHSEGKAAIEAEREVERAATARKRAQAGAERLAAAERKAQAELQASLEARSYVVEISGLYSARRIDDIVATAKKATSPNAARVVERAAKDRKRFVKEVRQLLSQFPGRPVEGIELITPHHAVLFAEDGGLVDLWAIQGGHFIPADNGDRKKYQGWKPGRIFHEARRPGCVAFKFQERVTGGPNPVN